MPTQNGLKLSLISHKHYMALPEIDHPETSQFTKRSPLIEKEGEGVWDSSPSSAPIESKADKLLGRQPSVSVYVPSTPGLRFWLRLEILEGLPDSTPYLFCKLLMNGRHVTSCGFPAVKPAGYRIMRGLFDPSDEYNYEDEKGIRLKNCGLERRNLYFAEEENPISPLDEGGVIEVRFFRARGRQQRMQDPPKFENQDGYGLVLAPGGLVEQPGNAKFYNWHLKDPKHKPFVVFKFYYRSWRTLSELHIVSPKRPKHLMPATPSLVSLAGHSRAEQYQLHEERFREVEVSGSSADQKLAVNQDDFAEERSEEEDEVDEVNEVDEVDEASEDPAIEKYDEDYYFSSDIDDRHEHPVSPGSSDADLEDNVDGLGEVPSAGEGKHQFAYQNLRSFWDAEFSNNIAARLLADQAPSGPAVLTDPGEFVTKPSIVEQGYLTPHYASNGDDLDSKSTMKAISKPEIDVLSQKMPASYLNRPLPTPPVRKSSFRKSFLSKVLANNKPSHSDTSEAQSGSANSSISELPLTTSVRAQSNSPKLDVARAVKHSGIAMLIDTPPRSKRDSVESTTSSRGASPAVTTSFVPMPRFSSLGRPAAHLRPMSNTDEYYPSPTSEEEYPIGTALSPPSQYAQHQTVQGLYPTTLPPPEIFDSQNTDPQKKSPRDAFNEAEQQQRGTALSPVSERSFSASEPDVHIPSLYTASSIASSSNRSIRERRLAAQHKSGPFRATSVNLRVIVPIVEEEDKPAHVRGERPSAGEQEQEKENKVYMYEIPTSAPQLRQPRRVSGVDNLSVRNLKSTPPKNKEDGEERVKSRAAAEWLKGKTSV